MSRHNKSILPIVNLALDMGFSVSRTRRNHLCFRKRGRRPVFISGTPSDHRAMKNAICQLRRSDRRR